MRHLFLLSFILCSSEILFSQTVVGTIQSGGLTREYRLYKPTTYTGTTPVPLIINLHGYTSSNLEQEFYASFKAIADTANFLVVMPNGTLDDQGQRFWNTFGGAYPVDDVAFIDNLLDTLEATYNIDPQRIYSTGMSNGGFMSYALACDLNNRITAIASVCGSMIAPNLSACNPQRPVPVMEIHGNADDVVPYDGGTLLNFVPIPDLVDAWVGFNNCNPIPVVTPVPDINTTEGCTAEHIVYSGGDKGSTVEHYKITGGGHTWPGAFFNIGVTNQDFNASYEIWRFFRQYRLDALSSAISPEITATAPWMVAPNPTQGDVVLQSENPNPVQNIQVYNVSGRLVQTIFPANSDLIRIQTAEWQAGMYFLVVNQEGGTSRLKVVKN
jgi:polyhydroxybutyrate depolymerase